MRIRQNLSPLRQTFSKAVSVGGTNISRAVSSGGVKLMRGVDALWSEFEKGMQEGAEPNQATTETSATAASIPGIPRCDIFRTQSEKANLTDNKL